MQRIEEDRLESDLAYRFEYLAEFIGFGDTEAALVHDAAPLIAPLVPVLVDAVYTKLFSYDATKRHFIPRQSGHEGALSKNLSSLCPDHEMIQFRKQHLGRYLQRLVTKPYGSDMVKYLNLGGKIHTPAAGSSELEQF